VDRAGADLLHADRDAPRPEERPAKPHSDGGTGGLTDISLHTLRHSAASALISSGVHMKVVQELLGHSSYAITADVYSHVGVSQQEDAADKLAEAFGW
jgi:integrase